VSSLEPRRGNRLSRSAREQRAYRLVLATGTFSALAVVGFVLAIVGVMNSGPAFLAAIIAIVCALLLRRTVGR
jgi:hypothetical protein